MAKIWPFNKGENDDKAARFSGVPYLNDRYSFQGCAEVHRHF